MARRNIDQEISILEAERDQIESILREQGRYQKLKAQGIFGSETTFTDFEALTRRLDRIKERLTTLYNGRVSV